MAVVVFLLWRETGNGSCTQAAVWWGSPTYDNELLGLRGPTVYKPRHHKLRWGIYYDIVSKCVYRFVLRKIRNGKVVFILEAKGILRLDQ
jgi:hypothetical protein